MAPVRRVAAVPAPGHAFSPVMDVAPSRIPATGDASGAVARPESGQRGRLVEPRRRVTRLTAVAAALGRPSLESTHAAQQHPL